MSKMSSTITLIISPYHTGLRDHRVGNGPHRILSRGLTDHLTQRGLQIEAYEIPPVGDFEGEIGRSFEVMRRISQVVTEAVTRGCYPLVVSGNCMATPAVACGLSNSGTIDDADKLGFIYFDSHDDLDSPDMNENGYFDAMGLSMLRGESWKRLMSTVPGYDSTNPFKYGLSHNRFLYCGLRDQSDIQRERVIEAGMDVIWGGALNPRTDFKASMAQYLRENPFRDTVVHLDLDVLDAGVYGKVNDYPSEGGLLENDLVGCMELVPEKSRPRALTVCQFDPDVGDGDRIADIAIHATVAFVDSLLKTGVLRPY